MSLKRQILIVMSLIALGLGVFLWWVPSRMLMSSFRQMEVDDLKEKVIQIKEIVESQKESLASKASDWAYWDDTYTYVKDHNKSYIKSNLSAISLVNLKINFFALLDDRKKVVNLFQIDPDKIKFVEVSKSFKEFIQSGSDFLSHSEAVSPKTGILDLPEGPTIVASLAVITSDRKGPVHGTLVFGRIIDRVLLDQMRRVSHLNLSFLSAESTQFQNIVRSYPELRNENSFAVEFENDNQALVYTSFKDVHGQVSFFAQIDEVREIYLKGRRTVIFVLSSVLIAALFFFFGTILFFQRRVLRRLFSLSKTVREIGETGSLDTRLIADASDELGELSRSINYMLGLLDDSQKEIHQATRALQHSNEQLVEKVVEAQRLNRQLESTQQQLVQSQKLESIGRLAGGIAHDFNNLLGAILGYVSLLENEQQIQDRIKRPLEIIRRSAERGAALTQQLLGFARMGTWEKKDVDLNASIDEAVKLLARSIPKEISIRTEVTKPLRIIEADSTQIFQVLMNLALNSRDAMPNGGTILLQSENVDVDEHMARSQEGLKVGSYVRVRVSDTGTGISKDIQSKVFDPFFSTKGVGKGSGLGLSMVYGIMQAHKGAITLYSEPGVGTVFNLYFPAKLTNKTTLSTLGNDMHTDLATKALHGKTILLVEDEELMRETAKDILEMSGAKVFEADSGLDGFELFKEESGKIDIVLSDLVMPRMGGIEMAKQIHSLNADMPILLSSGYSESSEIQNLRHNPLISFLQKPYRADELINTIAKALKSRATNKTKKNQNGG